jgi:hypothetical protein
VAPRREIEESARGEVLDHAAVAVQQHEWLAFAAVDVMEKNAVYLQEAA